MFRKLFYSFIFLFFTSQAAAMACDSCSGALGRCKVGDDAEEKRWFFDFTFEQQDWNEMDAREAHVLHHQGHEFHDKSHEEFYHFTLGANVTDSFEIAADLPYVSRSSIEVDSHATLGRRENSQGLGDLDVTATWNFLQNTEGSLGAVGGVKFPTGSTTEATSAGIRFEPELQPGSGSYDYTAGAAFQYHWTSLGLHGDALYTITTEGDQDFESGDAFTSHLSLESSVHKNVKLRIETELEIEQKETNAGVKIDDSGGVTLLAGPGLQISAGENISLFGDFLMPVYQNLGGVHQKLDFTWHAGAKVSW